ncbi:DUF1214 domain-containing protein [Microbacterium sp. KR10-403]|uniref:DUF1214 domain-containing protein n=1 Tax=Microbacterium sp. KR10-403 TaxID=3158581 RepID=UPI0032E49605
MGATWIAQSGIVQGVIIGATLAFLTAIALLRLRARALTRTVHGWRELRRCGQPGNGVLTRAACMMALPVVNSFDEAAYWTTGRDAAGRTLRGDRAYTLRFDAGGMPPADAFWSLTATDPTGYAATGSTGHGSVDDRTPFTTGADGSVELVLSHEEPAGAAANWLAVPTGRYRLMLRAYLPGAAILDGRYAPPPVEARP